MSVHVRARVPLTANDMSLVCSCQLLYRSQVIPSPHLERLVSENFYASEG